NELRWNPLAGQWVTIATERAARPSDFAPRVLPVEGEPGRPCPLCPGNEDEFPPALESYARDGDWRVRVVPNKYPAFRGVEPLGLLRLGPLFTQAPASGIHEVLVLSPDHHRAWADLDDRQVALVMAAVRDRVEEHARHAVVRHSLVIVNHGREAGASLEHPHGQLLGTPFVSRVVADEATAFDQHDGACLLCTMVDEERGERHRLVDDADDALVLSPYWAGSPYELLVLPTAHQGAVEASAPADVVAVGRAVRDGLRRVRRLLGDVPYNLILHSRPHAHEGRYHWHVHVVPRVTSVAGYEQGTGALINIVAPELAAQQLRRQDPSGD
ncbi:MAG TPA: galactose-1-phosphate uridylyltransferase, partial [Acidimicrobiales bacterium]|nr:galactose-1-phosphate uridylyltransferase [Acidimicrobiales bacterium]